MFVVRVCVRACIFTGEGEGVRGVMLQSFLDVAGEDGADKLSPKNERKKKGGEEKLNWNATLSGG